MIFIYISINPGGVIEVQVNWGRKGVHQTRGPQSLHLRMSRKISAKWLTLEPSLILLLRQQIIQSQVRLLACQEVRASRLPGISGKFHLAMACSLSWAEIARKVIWMKVAKGLHKKIWTGKWRDCKQSWDLNLRKGRDWSEKLRKL